MMPARSQTLATNGAMPLVGSTIFKPYSGPEGLL